MLRNKQVVLNLMVIAALLVSLVGVLPAGAEVAADVTGPASGQETRVGFKSAEDSQAAQPEEPTAAEANVKDEYAGLGDQEVLIIVRLSEPDVVNYTGGIAGLVATAPSATGEKQFNANTSASRAYLKYLADKQAEFVAQVQQFSKSAKAVANYQAAMNGVALRLSASDVAQVRKMPGVAAIYKSEILKLQTDRGPDWIGAPSVWSALGGQDVSGEGVVIGVIDTGAWSPNPLTPTLQYTMTHPSFASDASVYGGAYTFPFTSVTGVNFSQRKGVCAPVPTQSSDGTFVCNDKVIGGYWYNAAGIATATEFKSPLDNGGHGSHTASTAGGNRATSTVSGAPVVSGVAPRARIIAYKVCWEENPDISDDGGCGNVDSLSAANQAILDGVNVINFSISGGSSPTTDPVELAFLNARAAGIFVSASAGNDGPTPATTAHLGPWVNTSAAMMHDRTMLSDVIVTSTFGTPPTGLRGASATAGTTGQAVLAPSQFAGDTYPGQCSQPYAAGTFQATDVVVCRRGINARIEKSKNVQAGGAGGFILVNAADNQGLSLDAHWIPGVHLERNATSLSTAGENLVTYLLTAVPTNVVTITLSGGYAFTRTGDVMAAFSSRGPTGLNQIKPDNAAPGLEILAAVTPQNSENWTPDGNLYEYYNGTSMSSPHTAGAGALLKALHPDWTASEIQAALMTGAVPLLKEDGTTAATPFDQGAGRINLTNSMAPGLLFNVPTADYQAYISGTKQIETLNIPSFAQNSCLSSCSWTRRAENILTTTATYTWTAVTATPGLTVTLDQASYTFAAGETKSFTVTANVSALPNTGQHVFAQVILRETTTGIEVHMPVAVVRTAGVLPSLVTVNTRRDAGSQAIVGIQSVAAPNLTINSFGLTQATLTQRALPQDTTPGSVYDNLNDPGLFFITMTVPAGAQRLVAEVTDSTSLDIDLYVHRDANSDGLPQEAEQTCVSATGAVLEYCNTTNPASGTYIVLVQNWDASAAITDTVTLATAVVPNSDAGNMTVTGPITVGQLIPYDLNLMWNTPAMVAGDRWYGAFALGTTPATPGNIGTVPVNIVRLADDVVKTVNTAIANRGDTITYTIIVLPNVTPVNLGYLLTDTIPAGLTYVPGSVTATAGTGAVVGNQLTWSGTLDALTRRYLVTTSNTDASCVMPNANSGAYVDMSAYGFSPNSGVSGDTKWYSAFTTGAPFNYWGTDYTGIDFTDDGMAFFDSTPGSTPWINRDIPNAANPNNLLAMFWSDWEIVYATAPINRGVTLINFDGTGADGTSLIEYDDVQVYQTPDQTIDFEVLVRRTPNDAPGRPEVIFAYDNISLTHPIGTGTIGLENVDGTDGVKYAYDDVVLDTITNGMAICFDWGLPVLNPVIITYQATVNQAVAAGTVLTNQVQHDTDNPGSQVAVTSVNVTVAPDLTINVVGNGSVTQVPLPPYTPGDVVTLTAVAGTGSSFAGWSGALTGTANPVTITLDADKVVTATFTANPVNLTINTVGNGTVTQVPPAPYVFGDVVTLTAVAGTGFSFTGWSGALSGTTNPITITLDGDKVVTATFTLGCTDVAGVDFTFAPTAPKVGQPVVFNGQVLTGTAPLTYTWNFGDGITGILGQVVTHTYALTATTQMYTVTLTAENACSSGSAQRLVTVQPYLVSLPIVLK